MYTQCSIRYFLRGPVIIIQRYHLDVLFFIFIIFQVLAGVVLGVDGVIPGVLLSSDELNDSQLCTGLGGACNVFCGVTGSGSNELCLMLETW